MDKIQKALISAMMIYALIFLCSFVLMQVMAVDIYYSIITTIFAALVAYAISRYYYFAGMKIKEPLTEGITFGVLATVVMFLIDVPLMVYGFAAEVGWTYFMQLHIMASYSLTVIIPVIAAYVMKK